MENKNYFNASNLRSADKSSAHAANADNYTNVINRTVCCIHEGLRLLRSPAF